MLKAQNKTHSDVQLQIDLYNNEAKDVTLMMELNWYIFRHDPSILSALFFYLPL